MIALIDWSKSNTIKHNKQKQVFCFSGFGLNSCMVLQDLSVTCWVLIFKRQNVLQKHTEHTVIAMNPDTVWVPTSAVHSSTLLPINIMGRVEADHWGRTEPARPWGRESPMYQSREMLAFSLAERYDSAPQTSTTSVCRLAMVSMASHGQSS